MAKQYRGDTLPVVVSYDGYTFKNGDVVTAGILQLNESTAEYDVLKEVSLTVTGEADEVQLEFSREDMHDIEGDVVLEVRTVTAGNVEMTIQKNLSLGKDGLR
jgi:hypothetical protein